MNEPLIPAIRLPVLENSDQPGAPRTVHGSQLPALREKLAASQGRDYWRSLEEVAETPEFQEYVEREFSSSVFSDPMSRRDFLKVMGASLALAFASGCRRWVNKIVPYNEAPEDFKPDQALFFASSLPLRGYGRGVLVESHQGRPTKVEGNPLHPDSLGATDIFMQAAPLTFYDPDRSQYVINQGTPSTWDEFLETWRRERDALLAQQGAGLRILTETVTSPSMAALLDNLARRFPKMKWHSFEPLHRDAVWEGARLAFGQPLETRYRFEDADVVVSLDADFLWAMPGSLHYARAFMDRRRIEVTHGKMNRLYAIAPTPTITTTSADHYLALRPSDIHHFTETLAAELGVGQAFSQPPSKYADWVKAVASDLRAHQGRGLILAGDNQPAAVHALVHAMNERLHNAGTTVVYTKPVVSGPLAQMNSLKELTEDMRHGEVRTLFMIGGNPVFTAPADLSFTQALGYVKNRFHMGLYVDETAVQCQWHIPQAHPLESWGDLRAYDGTVSLIQPLIAPLYDGKTPQELLEVLLHDIPADPRTLLQDYYLAHTMNSNHQWDQSVHDGLVADTVLPAQHASVRLDENALAAARKMEPPSDELELVFYPDSGIWDGRFANNGWLQELPRPLTKLTWENVVYVSPRDAEHWNLENGDIVELDSKGRKVLGPVWILPGQAEGSITVTLGYGRSRAGRVGNNIGFNAFLLRTTEARTFASLRKTHDHTSLASTQNHFTMDGRDLLRTATLADYQNNPHFAQKPEKEPSPENSLYNYSKPSESPDYAWAMGIDLNMCMGCNACVLACQAENNVPIVGKDQVLQGRHMHWLRVDRYFHGGLDQPESFNQPVPCMHCEDAPCEVVCPTEATQHSPEGLNEMVYNRCIGTRYCSNNCPYKVRRFNFLYYTKDISGPLELLQNPDVTVRSRGVMEKCTYCVQRIQAAKIKADGANRLVQEGEIVPACAQACPTRAISFGNLKQPKSEVSQQRLNPRNYGLLAELGTRPRTTYLAALRNPNPDLEKLA